MIPYGRQSLCQDDIVAVAEVLHSDWLTQGPALERFERSVAEYCGAAHALAVCNGTAALHLACLALDIGPGDILWTSANTFVASANCARYCGAEVDFVDIDLLTHNLSVEALRRKLEQARRENRLPKALVAVHFAGHACPMAEIAELARDYHFAVIEDACHALGGDDRDDKVGASRHSQMTVFSFHPVKSITTGEGGMILTNDAALAERLRLLRSHGITRDPQAMTEPAHGPWYYEQQELGFNYRMSDIQAALGLSQLGRLNDFIARRRALAQRYRDRLKDLPLVLPGEAADVRSAWHLYVIRLRDEAARSRDEVFAGLRAAGIGVNLHYIPLYRQPYYRARYDYPPAAFPAMEDYYRSSISLPLYPGLTEAEQDRVVTALSEFAR